MPPNAHINIALCFSIPTILGYGKTTVPTPIKANRYNLVGDSTYDYVSLLQIKEVQWHGLKRVDKIVMTK